MKKNDIDCLSIVLKKMNSQEFYINQGVIMVLLGLDQDDERRAILDK